MMKIEKIENDYPYELLLIADETIEAIHKYLFDSDVYIARNQDEIIAVFCLLPYDEDIIEIKNIAVLPKVQNQGIGSFILKEIQKIVENEYKTIILGTGDCGFNQIRFYEKNGYSRYAIKENFFLENYEKPIFENGIMLKDMIMLKKEIR